jgi:hypothetical protein
VVKGETLLRNRVVHDPGTIKKAKSELEEVAERRYGIREAAGSRFAIVDKVVNGAKQDIQSDECKGSPLNDDFLSLTRKQSDQGLCLRQPEKRIGYDADNLEFRAVRHG